MFQNTDQVHFSDPMSVSTILERMIPGDRRRLNGLMRDLKQADEHGNIIGLSGLNPQVRQVSILNEEGEVDSIWHTIAPELPHSESQLIMLQRSGISWRYTTYTVKDGLKDSFKELFTYEPKAADGGNESILESL